jgi:hypothetical protein
MSTNTRIRRLLGGLGTGMLALALGYMAIRPIHLRWGATDAEVARAMPGDLAIIGWTRAATIKATPEQIWPWLAQWGQGRGGWYSYDWLENLFGMDIHTADRILPEQQRPAIGDPICLSPSFCSQVFIVEPGHFFGWQATPPGGPTVWTFILGLYPLDATHTRLVMRESFDRAAMPLAALAALEMPDAVMELKTLHTLKVRAEGATEPAITTALEILLWLAALTPGLAAGTLMLTREGWRPPLALGLASVAALLALTFLFPPLWLRAALDVGLWIALAFIGSRRQRRG